MLTDTFNLNERQPGIFLSENNERAERQEKARSQVIVGNPPWSAWQKSSADDNPNASYPEMEARIADTYAARSTATLKSSLYDTYQMAIRWASDRSGEQGGVALVTNGSWSEGNVDSGVRACMAEEFTSIHVVNLRGNQRTQGERSRQEGGKIFGSGSRAPVAITILVKNPGKRAEGCRILYHDIGDYLRREEKLAILRDAESISGIAEANPETGWREIEPDEHHDWIGQRDAAFQGLYPIGTKEVKAGKADDAVFGLYSSGYKTSRDAYTYNLSRPECAANAQAMVDDYMGALLLRERRPDYPVDGAADEHSSGVRWDRELKNNMRRGRQVSYSADRIRQTQYRPFVRSHCYVDYVLVNNKYQQDRLFPLGFLPESGANIAERISLRPANRSDLRSRRRVHQAVLGARRGHDARPRGHLEGPVLSEVPLPPLNRVICVPGIGSTKPFSALVAERMPDLHFLSFGQCFPRWVYSRPRGYL